MGCGCNSGCIKGISKLYGIGLVMLCWCLLIVCGLFDKYMVSFIDDEVLIFVFFCGNGQDGLYLVVSEDGLNWQVFNQDESVLMFMVGMKLMCDFVII